MTQPKAGSKSSSHTPGPWKEKTHSLRILTHVRNEDGGLEPFCVADCDQSLHLSCYLAPGERVANARLILKAPEMYELLSTLLEKDNYQRLGRHEWNNLMKAARRIKAAIDGEE